MLEQRSLFTSLYKLASISAITPFYDFKTRKLVAQRFSKIFCVIVTLLTLVVLFPILHLIKYNTKNKLIVFLINCTMGTSCLSAVTMTLCSFTKRRQWERMLHLIRYAENAILIKTDTQYRKHKALCLIIFCFMSLLSLVYSIYEIWIEVMQNDYMRLPIFYLRYIMVIFVFLSIEICEIIYYRFRDLNEFIKACLLNTTILQITNEKVVLMDISKIRRNYRILNELVECYNKVFGMGILTLALNVLFHILHSMNVFIFEWKNCSLDMDLTIRSFAPTIWCCVSISSIFYRNSLDYFIAI